MLKSGKYSFLTAANVLKLRIFFNHSGIKLSFTRNLFFKFASHKKSCTLIDKSLKATIVFSFFEFHF